MSEEFYFHPWHNMFLSLAHTAEDVNTTLDAVEFAMKKISEEFSSIYSVMFQSKLTQNYVGFDFYTSNLSPNVNF